MKKMIYAALSFALVSMASSTLFASTAEAKGRVIRVSCSSIKGWGSVIVYETDGVVTGQNYIMGSSNCGGLHF